MNVMKEIRIAKVTLNMGTGGPGERLEKGLKLLNKLTNMKPVPTTTKKRIPTWDIRPGLQIGCKVTVRGKKGEELLKRILTVHKEKLNQLKFDSQGNFSFGVEEYLDIPGIQYDPSIGIIGFDIAVTLERPGFRISKRTILKRKIPMKHKITKEEAIDFVNKKFTIEVAAQ